MARTRSRQWFLEQLRNKKPISGELAEDLVATIFDREERAQAAATAAESVTWDTLAGKPSTFPPSNHTHPAVEETDPTVPPHVKAITQVDIAIWNNAAKNPTIVEIESFPASEILLLPDNGNDLWDKPDGKCCFRNDFVIKGYSRLKYFKSIFTANNGHASGRFAIYGAKLNNADFVKLADEFLPDNDDCGIVNFDIDISEYEILIVCMDPGVDGIPQPISQAVFSMPPYTALSRYVWAGLAPHVPLTEFPSEPPSIIDSSPKYFIRRWMAIGVR